MAEDKERILKLLEEGKISPEDAARLLDAVGEGGSSCCSTNGNGVKNRFLKVKVTERGASRPKVNITLPVALVKWGMRFAPHSARANIAEHEIDPRVITEALEKGITGKIVEVDNEGDGEHIEVWLE